MKKLRLYLAGPDVFREQAKDYGEQFKSKLKEFDLKGLYPFDNEIVDEDPNKMSKAIFKANLRMIKKCDIVLANLDPFRGPSCDAGTAMEIGYAKALKKPVIGYYCETTPGVYKERVELFRKATQCDDKYYNQIEDFGLQDNLMIILGCNKVFPSLDDAVQHIIDTRDEQ